MPNIRIPADKKADLDHLYREWSSKLSKEKKSEELSKFEPLVWTTTPSPPPSPKETARIHDVFADFLTKRRFPFEIIWVLHPPSTPPLNSAPGLSASSPMTLVMRMAPPGRNGSAIMQREWDTRIAELQRKPTKSADDWPELFSDRRTCQMKDWKGRRSMEWKARYLDDYSLSIGVSGPEWPGSVRQRIIILGDLKPYLPEVHIAGLIGQLPGFTSPLFVEGPLFHGRNQTRIVISLIGTYAKCEALPAWALLPLVTHSCFRKARVAAQWPEAILRTWFDIASSSAGLGGLSSKLSTMITAHGDS
jgi:hypothetical protein